ncbi:MAG: hypothetical protein JW934_18930 [Anaerolineae bacterium]|nr:hypothetical protein [Anaerolineae bacterium]
MRKTAIKVVRWMLGVVLTFLLAWKLVAELIEPHVLLWFTPRQPYLEAETVGGTRLRLYQDTRPYVGKIAGLQKGLVWVQGRQVLTEEAYGFGCPIIIYNGLAYNSAYAEIDLIEFDGFTRLTKVFTIDTADTPIRFLRRKYKPVPSLGEIVFQYDIYPGGVIEVSVDFSGLTVEWSQAYLMSEQGAHHFTRYTDSNGADKGVDQLGIWQTSQPLPEWACFERQGGKLCFCVKPNSEAPAILYYGRERYNQYNWRGLYYLAWSGMDLEIDPTPTYRYRILLEAE